MPRGADTPGACVESPNGSFDGERRATAREQLEREEDDDAADPEPARDRETTAAREASRRAPVDDIRTVYSPPADVFLMPGLWCIPNVDDMSTQKQRQRRLLMIGGVLLAAVVAIAVVIGVSSGGSSTTTTTA